MPRLGPIGEAGFKKRLHLLLRLDPLAFRCHLWSDAECACIALSYRRRHCEQGITTRGCSGGKGSNDTRFYGVGSGDVGKELPRNKPVVFLSFVGGHARSTTGNVSRMHVCSGDTLGSTIVVRGSLHTYSKFHYIFTVALRTSVCVPVSSVLIPCGSLHNYIYTCR